MRDHADMGLPGWGALAGRRRMRLGALVLLPSAAAGWAFSQTLPSATPLVSTVGLALVFSTLFAWTSWGAWTALAGFLVLRRNRFCASPAPASASSGASSAHRGSTAIVFPICDEDVERVFAGVQVTYRSLLEATSVDGFEFYILSDSHDPDTWIDEEAAWARLCKGVDGFGRIYYRRRPAPSGGKAGNIAEFCRGWGRRYRYMVVLDADSIMAGSTIVQLVALMDTHPDVGIIQTLPTPVNKASLFARIRQFSSRLCGPLCAAGMHFWQLGDGVYWGHNAIIRVEPFMASCGLPRLPGTPPLGGQVMSHDFVEAALIRRAGWTVWLAYDLEGSYEEIPTTIPDHLKRDRRWCRGNLQHGRLLSLPGLSVGHRLHFLLGICAYVMSPLWMLFLAAEMVVAATGPQQRGGDFSAIGGTSLHADWAIGLFAATFAMLLLPKVLALALVLADDAAARRFGGRRCCALSVGLELLLSAVVAPAVMVSHAWFVISILSGARVRWAAQRRRDYALTWRDAWRDQAGVTALGIVWMIVATRIQFPVMVEWLAPMFAGLLLSIPVSVYSSSAALGDLTKRWGFFLTPEEMRPPRVLRQLRRALESGPRRVDTAVPRGNTFAQTVVDPYVNAHHIWQMMFRAEDRAQGATFSLLEKALQTDPGALYAEEKAAFLDDPDGLARLHIAVWSSPEPIARRWWAHALDPDQHA